MKRFQSIARSGIVGGTVMLALAAAACSDLLGLGNSEVDLALRVDASIGYPVRLEVTIDGRTFQLDAEETRTVEVGGSGAQQTLALLLSGTDTLAADAAAQTFPENSDNWLHAWVGGPRPVGLCLGAVSAAALSGHAPDSVFVLRGNLPKGAVC